ncbi:MAG: hypothetical protein WC606_00220 [Candidatus Absconditabacterales bacterium]
MKGKRKGKSDILVSETETINSELEKQDKQEKKELIETLITHIETLPLQNYTIDKSGITISSERGGSLSSLILDGVEIFYNNPERRNDRKQSLREGYRMGPQAGPFSSEQNAEHGFDLQQHGFLRDVAWKKDHVVGKEVGYQFTSDENNFKKFPYNFTATQTIELGEKGARISLNVQNTGKNVMKFAPGHHTYYKVSPDQKANIKLSKNMGVTEEMILKWISGTETIKILNPGSCQIYIPGIGLLQLNFDPKFKDLRLRSEKEKGFVCIEPVVCHPRERNESAINIKPKEAIKIGFSITLLSKDKNS